MLLCMYLHTLEKVETRDIATIDRPRCLHLAAGQACTSLHDAQTQDPGRLAGQDRAGQNRVLGRGGR